MPLRCRRSGNYAEWRSEALTQKACCRQSWLLGARSIMKTVMLRPLQTSCKGDQLLACCGKEAPGPTRRLARRRRPGRASARSCVRARPRENTRPCAPTRKLALGSFRVNTRLPPLLCIVPSGVGICWRMHVADMRRHENGLDAETKWHVLCALCIPARVIMLFQM